MFHLSLKAHWSVWRWNFLCLNEFPFRLEYSVNNEKCEIKLIYSFHWIRLRNATQNNPIKNWRDISCNYSRSLQKFSVFISLEAISRIFSVIHSKRSDLLVEQIRTRSNRMKWFCGLRSIRKTRLWWAWMEHEKQIKQWKVSLWKLIKIQNLISMNTLTYQAGTNWMVEHNKILLPHKFNKWREIFACHSTLNLI